MYQINLKLTPEVKALFQQVYDELKSSSEVSTLNEFIELLLERFLNPPKRFINSPEVSMEIANARNIISQLRAELAEANQRHQHQVAVLNNEIRMLKATKTERVEVERVVEKSLAENQVLITLQPWVKVLLQATVNKLSKKANKAILPENIFVSNFARYTVERNSAIFYDFVLSKDEMEQLTGYRREHLIARAKALL